MIAELASGNVCTCGHLRIAHVRSELTLEAATCIARIGVNDCGVNPTYCPCAAFTEASPGGVVPTAAPSLSADLAAWNHHQRGCVRCTTAPNAAALCLSGAVLWQRAGLEVIPVPISARDFSIADRRTSTLLRLAADLLSSFGVGSGRETIFVGLDDELCRRAAYLETLGDHDLPNGGAR